MRFSSAFLTVLFGLVAGSVLAAPAPKGDDRNAPSDLYARDVNSGVFERGVDDSLSIANRSVILEARATPLDLTVQFTGAVVVKPAKEDDVREIVQFVTNSAWSGLKSIDKAYDSLGKVEYEHFAVASLDNLNWRFKPKTGKGADRWYWTAHVKAGPGGISEIREASVMDYRGHQVWEKRATRA